MHCLGGLADLGAGGCFVTSLDQSAPAGRVRLHLQLPGDNLIWLSAEVAHFQRHEGFGVTFVGLSRTDRIPLEQGVSALEAATPR